MEKIIKDRINQLKSDLSTYKQPKMGKYMARYHGLIKETEIRIDELERLINNINKTKL